MNTIDIKIPIEAPKEKSSTLSFEQLQQRIDKVKIEISALMSRYLYEEDFYIEDTDLDKLLQILDKGSDNNE